MLLWSLSYWRIHVVSNCVSLQAPRFVYCVGELLPSVSLTVLVCSLCKHLKTQCTISYMCVRFAFGSAMKFWPDCDNRVGFWFCWDQALSCRWTRSWISKTLPNTIIESSVWGHSTCMIMWLQNLEWPEYCKIKFWLLTLRFCNNNRPDLQVYEVGGGTGTGANNILSYFKFTAPNVYKTMTYTSGTITPNFVHIPGTPKILKL